MSLAPELLDIIVCPKDKGELLYLPADNTLYNPRLRLRYPIRNGNIPVLLIDEAETVDETEHERLLRSSGD